MRPDLADVRLAQRVFAPHYADPIRCAAARRVAVHAAPGDGGAPLSELLAGDPFDMLELSSGHIWGYSPIDGVVGYIPADALASVAPATHLVAVRGAAVHAHADADSAALLTLPMGSRVIATFATDAMVEVDGGYMRADTLVALHDLRGSPADFVERLVGVPTVPGGRSGLGVDAAGLVHLGAMLAGIDVPRFADRIADTGEAIDGGYRRGDILCFADHVAVAIDSGHVVHAAPGGKVERVATDTLLSDGGFGPLVSVRRLA